MLASVSLYTCPLFSAWWLHTAMSNMPSPTFAQLHEYGGKRNIRYRDLNAAILGRWAYYPVRCSTIALQNIAVPCPCIPRAVLPLYGPAITGPLPAGPDMLTYAADVGHPVYQLAGRQRRAGHLVWPVFEGVSTTKCCAMINCVSIFRPDLSLCSAHT